MNSIRTNSSGDGGDWGGGGIGYTDGAGFGCGSDGGGCLGDNIIGGHGCGLSGDGGGDWIANCRGSRGYGDGRSAGGDPDDNGSGE